MKKPLTPLPADFTLTSELIHWAAEHHYTHIVERFEFFCDYCRASGKQYADHAAAFRNSVRGDWAKLNKAPSFTQTVVERGTAMGLQPRPGEEMADYMRRVAQARH